jgi:phytol kinase
VTLTATALTMLALVAATGTLLGGLRYYQLRCRPDPEVVRKLFHIGGGALGLSLPWIFDDLLPVLLLALAVTSLFVAIRVLPRLREGVGQVFLAVERSTVGEFGFLASFCLLFWLARDDKLLYSIPIMMVALADALAALIGQSYGKRALHIAGNGKTVEGAVTFLLIAFFCVHVPVLLWAETGRLESLLIAINVAAMVMLAEAAAWRGLDNLIIPLGGYMVLKSLLEATSPELAVNLVFLASLGAFMVFWRSRATLGDDALAGAVLWGYVTWSVGGLPWALASLLQLAAYATVTARTPLDRERNLRFPVVLANVAGSIPWLLAYRESADPALFVPFATCFGANVAIIALVRAKFADPALALRPTLTMSIAAGMLIVVPSMLAAYGPAMSAVLGTAAAFVATAAAAAVFYLIQPAIASLPVNAGRWVRQAIVVGVASLLAFALLRIAQWMMQ